MLNVRIKKVLFIFVILITTYAHADSLSYSGRLVNANGSPVTGPVDLRFDLASTANTSSILCTQDINNVALTNGVFHVKLDLDCGTPSLSQVLATIVSPNAAAVRVTNLSASKVYSFQELHAVPTAQVAHGLSKLNANNNEVLTWTGSKWEPKPIVGATGGTVTDITAGTGLSGGTITNSGTISIANGGVTDTHLAGNISRSKMANGTANYVLVNNGAGAMSEVAQLPLSLGGTGASTQAGARTNLGLGTAATATVGYASGNVLPADNIPVCLPTQKLQFTGIGPTYWGCSADVDTNNDATKLPLAGGTMTGDIDMGGKSITNVANPVNPGDAANMAYVDAQIGGASVWSKSGAVVYYNSGNVGIGTSAPDQKLHLVSSGSSAQLALERTGASSGKAYVGADNNGFHIFDSAYVRKLTVSPTGDVGIGTITPVEKLEVVGNAAFSGKLRLKSDNANFVELKAPASLASTLTFNLPGVAGTSGQALITDGSGNLSWATVATGASAVGGDLTGTVTNAQIAAGAIVDADVSASAAIAQSKINGLTTALSGKEPTITAGTTAQYWRGDKTWSSLQADVQALVMNGFAVGSNSAVTSADSLSGALGKVQGQINAANTSIAALSTTQANYVLKAGDTMSGALAMGNNKITGLATPTVGTDAATMAYVDSKVSAAPGDNLGNHTATTNLSLGSNKILVGDGTWSSPGITFTNSLTTGLFNNSGILGFSASGSLAMNLSSSSLIMNGSYAPYLRLGGGTFNAANPTYAFNGDPNTGMFNISTDILGFTTGGVERTRILATGEMAIGKATADGKLDVAGDIALDGMLKLKSDSGNFVQLRAPASLAATNTYTFPANAGTSGYVLTTDGAGGLSWSQAATTATNVGGDLTGTIANAQIAPGAIYNADIANLTITYAKLNILDEEFPLAKLAGTPDATKYLKGNKTWGTFLTDVLASTFATVTPSNTAITNGDSLSTVVNKTQGQINQLKTDSSSYLIKNATDNITGTVSLAGAGALKIPTTPSGADLTDAANVQYVQNYVGTFGQWTKTSTNLSYSAGNVGIGIASPWDQFMVYKANNVATASIVSDNTSTTVARYPSIAVKNFGGGGAGAIGNPVIELVNLRGNSTTTAVMKSGDTLGGISFSGSTNTSAAYKEGANIRSLATQNFSTSAAGGSLLFATTANSTVSPIDRMIIDQNGFVGIGTLAPAAKLDIGAGNVNFDTAYGLTSDNGAKLQTGSGGLTWMTTPGDASAASFAANKFDNSTALLVTGAGDVGIGTSTPQAKLHVTGSPGRSIQLIPAATSVDTSRIEFRHNDNGNVNALYATIQGYLQDGSSGANAGNLIFYTAPLGTGNPGVVERMRIHHTGFVGIGTATPAAKLSVTSDGNPSAGTMAIQTSGQFGGGVKFNDPGGNVDGAIYTSSGRLILSAKAIATTAFDPAQFVLTTGGAVGIGNPTPAYKLDVNGNIRGYGIADASDIRLKNTIVPLRPEEDLEKILKLNSVSYFWNDKTQERDKQIGFIAQEMEKIYPELVETDKNGMKAVNYSHLVSPITNAIKALHTKQSRDIASLKSENEKLRDENAKMKKENEDIKSRLERLEKALLKQK